jgi:phage FluMu protein Com
MTARCAACGEPLDLKRGEGLGAAVLTVFCPRCDQIAPDTAIAPIRRPILRLPSGRGTRKVKVRKVGSRGRGP